MLIQNSMLFVPKAAQFSDVENLDYRLRTIVDMQKEKVKRYKETRGRKMEFKKLCEKKGTKVILKSLLLMKNKKRTFCSTNPSHEKLRKEIVDPDEIIKTVMSNLYLLYSMIV